MYKIYLGTDDVDSAIIYDPTRQSTHPVVEARLSEKLNEAGALSFTLAYGHPKFDSLNPFESYVTVYNGNSKCFYGRIIEAGLPTFAGQQSFECEGALSFLKDSEITTGKTVKSCTVQEFFEWCISSHNSDINSDERRVFRAGNVTVDDKDKSTKFQVSSYTQTLSVIQNNLLNVYGGYLKVRFQGSRYYLDWLKDYPDEASSQSIRTGFNIIDRSISRSAEDFYTHIRPVGKNGITLDNPYIRVVSSSAVNKYGRIVKSVSFSDQDTKAKLQTKANEYVNNLKIKLMLGGSIEVVDQHYINISYGEIKLGQKFSNINGLEGTELLVTDLERDLMQPWHISLNLDNDLTNKNAASNPSAGISHSTASNGSALGAQYKHIIEIGDQVTINAETLIEQGETLRQHYERIVQTANDFARLSSSLDGLQSIVDDYGERLIAVEGTGVIQNSEHISLIAGKFTIDKDGNVVLEEGTDFRVTKDGATISVIGLKTDIGTIMGSALWTQQNKILGVVGEYEIQIIDGKETLVIKAGGGMVIERDGVQFGLYDEGNLTGGMIVDKLDDGTVHTLISGDLVDITAEQMASLGIYTDGHYDAGLLIRRINANTTEAKLDADEIRINGKTFMQAGLVDENGNLTAGMIVQKINDSDSSVTIQGSKIILGNLGSLSDHDVEWWMQRAYDGTGVFAKYLTVKKLTAEEISTMFENSEFSKVDRMTVGVNVSEHAQHAGLIVGRQLEFTSGTLINYQGNGGTVNPVSQIIVDATVDQFSNTLTLTKLDGTTVTFSKAASGDNFYLSGSWSGSGLFTVRALRVSDDQPIGYNLTRNLSYGAKEKADGSSYNPATDGNTFYIPVRAYYGQTPPTYEETGYRIVVDASANYNAGVNSVVQTAPTGTLIGDYDIVRTGSISADGESSLFTLANGFFRPTGASEDIPCVTLSLARTNIGRVDIPLQPRVTVTPSSQTQTINYNASNYYGLKQVVVNPESHSAPSGTAIDQYTEKKTGSITADGMSSTFTLSNELYRPSGTTVDIPAVKLNLGGTNIGRINIPLQPPVTVTPSTSSQTISYDSGYYGLSKVTVGAVVLRDEVTVTPSTSAQTITYDANTYQGLSSVKVKAVTHSAPSGTAIDQYTEKKTGSITADGKSSNFTLSLGTYRPSGTTTDIPAVKLNLGGTDIGRIGIPLQPRVTVTPSSQTQTINYNASTYYGLKQVVVNAVTHAVPTITYDATNKKFVATDGNDSSKTASTGVLSLSQGSISGSGSSGKRTISLLEGTAARQSTVCTDYGTGYDAGWADMQNMVTSNWIPSYAGINKSRSSSSDTTLTNNTIKLRNKLGGDGNAVGSYGSLPIWYTLSDNKKIVRVRLNSSGGTVVLQADSGYQDGYDAGYTKGKQDGSSTSHKITYSATNSYYTQSSTSEDAAKQQAAQAMGTSVNKLTPITTTQFKNNRWVWFKITCGGSAKYYYVKITS